VHLSEVKVASDVLAPGFGGAALLLLAQLAYVPNAIIWAVAYTIGPGFAFGAGTTVSPTGSALGPVPLFPMLAAIPSGGHPGVPGWVPVAVLALPYLAGVFAGVVTVRITPTPVIEAAPLWGFTAGAAAGLLAGLAAAFAGGPLGHGRLASVGPNGFQVGLVAILELGITAALSAAAANWLILRRAQNRVRDTAPVGPQPPPPRPLLPHGQRDEGDDASGHRIYLNPWAAASEEDEDEIPVGVIEEYPDGS
jgi:hypothetical protein